MIELVIAVALLYAVYFMLERTSWIIFCKYTDACELKVVRASIAKRKEITLRYK